MVTDSVFGYRPRLVDPLLDRLFAQLPAIIVVGPRAVGKTTTLSRRVATRVRFDREREAAVFEADPDAALAGLPEPVLVDEWQVVPGVLGAVRRAVDADPRPGRFFVTGSVRGEVEREAWPGTGRLIRVAMHPMTMREHRGQIEGPTVFERIVAGADLTVPTTTPDLRGYVELALKSGFPDPALRLDTQARRTWLESYIDDLLTHDVEQLESHPTRRRDTQRLRRYFEALALNSAGVTDHRTIYDAADVSRVTALDYEELLARLFLVATVPAWTSNRLKRLVMRPKRYVVDPALLATALGADEVGIMRDGDLLGRVLETFVFSQLRAELQLSATRPRLYHLRTPQGRHEIDLLAEIGGQRLIAFEIKATGAPRARRDARHLAWLRDELEDRFLCGVVFHTGPRVLELGDRLVAAPISVLWG